MLNVECQNAPAPTSNLHYTIVHCHCRSGDPDDLDNGKPSKKRAKTVGTVDADEDVDSMDSNSTPKTNEATEGGATTSDGTLAVSKSNMLVDLSELISIYFHIYIVIEGK